MKRARYYILLKPGKKNPKPHPESGGHHLIHAKGVGVEKVLRYVKNGGNVGVSCNDRAVLDFDDPEGLRELFERLGPLDMHVKSPKGVHCHVARDPGLPSKIYCDGVTVGDVKRLPTEYVLVPPSIVDGKQYRSIGTGIWNEHSYATFIDLKPLPANWHDYLLSEENRPAPGTGSRDGERFEIPDRVPTGERHRTFFRWTRSWKAQGLALDDALEIIRLANETITDEPLGDHELEKYVRRCWDQPDREGFRR